MSTNPFTAAHTWDLTAPGYWKYNQDIFTYFANRAMSATQLTTGEHVVDVATGPGSLALQAAAVASRVDALDFSESMLEQLSSRMTESGVDNVFTAHGDGQALPYESSSFDVGFSLFGLMFFPDRNAGFTELYRVLRPKGRALVASWTPMDQIVHFTELFSALADAQSEPPPEKGPDPVLSTPQMLQSEMEAVGFDVQVIEVTTTMITPNIEMFMESCKGGFAPICLMRERLGEEAFDALWQTTGAAMKRRFGKGIVAFPMTALFGIGTKR